MSENIFGDTIQKRTQELCYARGWKVEDLAEKSGLPEDTVKNIWHGRTKNPQVSTVYLIANAFGLTLNCFLGKCTHTVQEKELLRNYRECGKNGKSNISLIARYEATAAKYHRDSPNKHTINCVIPHGSMHKGILYGSCDNVSIETAVQEAYVAIKMPTNDFAPKYCKDDILLFEDRFPHNGEYVAVLKDNKAYIRKFLEEDNHYRLKCLHNYDEDIILKHMDEIRLIGTFCGKVRNQE